MIACGPPHVPTLAASSEVRVYEQRGHAFGCDRNGRTRDLGPRMPILAVKVAAFRAAVRRSRPNGHEEIDVYSLRTARKLSHDRVKGRIGPFAIDRNGVTLYVRAQAGKDPWVKSNGGFSLGGPGIYPNFLHFASAIVAFRDPYGVHTWQLRGGAKDSGTLYRSGRVRVIAHNLELDLRAPGFAKHLGYPLLDCYGSGGCDGIDTLQVAGRFAGVHWTGFDREGDTFGKLDVYDTATGVRARPCGFSEEAVDYVETFVLTKDGLVACMRVLNGTPRVVSNGVVIDEGKGIDPHTLARRGDQLVWRHDGLQRTAPLPTASG